MKKYLLAFLFICSTVFGAAFIGAGSGTQADPYVITNYNELCSFSSCDNANKMNGYWRLDTDIDASASTSLNGGTGWMPVGDYSFQDFYGHFDGNFHKITGIYINRTITNTRIMAYGFFGQVGGGAVISNLGLENISITIRNNTYDPANTRLFVGGFVGNNYGNITNCYVTGSLNGSLNNTGGDEWLKEGGFTSQLGYSNQAIVNCYSAVAVTGICPGTVRELGGFAGGTTIVGTLTGCYYDSAVCGVPINSIANPKTTQDMKKRVTFAGWDFSEIWDITENVTYPYYKHDCTVPEVIGLSQVQATANLEASEFIAGTITSEYHNTIPAGNVISQSVTGDTDCGATVDLVISLGKPAVPNIIGMNLQDATLAITANSLFSVGDVAYQISDTVEQGLIISQNPVAGTKANLGSGINYVLSLGPAGLKAWYKCDENADSATVKDTTGTQDGSFEGGIGSQNYTSAKHVKGIVGTGAFKFNGTDTIRIPNNAALNFGNDSFSVCFWIKFDSVKTPLPQFFINKEENQIGWGVEFWDMGQGIVGMSMDYETQDSGWASATRCCLNDGRWHFIAFSIYRHNTAYPSAWSYTDGRPDKFKAELSGDELPLDTTCDVIIGQGFTDGTMIDDIRIYNKSLTASEVLNIYNETRGRTVKGSIYGTKPQSIYNNGSIFNNIVKSIFGGQKND